MQTNYQMAFRAFLSTYAYHQADLLLSSELPPNAQFLLKTLRERRELDLSLVFDHFGTIAELADRYNFPKPCQDREEEQLVNYIYDLEAKLKSGQLIDFVRGVSPIIYRLYLRLLQQQLPDLQGYISNAKSDQYDRWRFDLMTTSDHSAIQRFLSRKRDSRVTSSSLVDLLLETDLPAAIKETALLLRQFEKNVRNPLAHLIKPFDEEELHRTTGFSSQRFLEGIIRLAQASGLTYDTETFYFDRLNRVILELMG